MTLDVRIGKLCLSKFDPEFPVIPVWADVEGCEPLDYDLCKSPEFTLWPRESYRSGSSGFWSFFRDHLPEIYYAMREHPDSNDHDVARIKPLIKKIKKLPDNCGDPIDDDRMKWFKFWCIRAVKLYGDDAGISFS